jgi:hypothetical protein
MTTVETRTIWTRIALALLLLAGVALAAAWILRPEQGRASAIGALTLAAMALVLFFVSRPGRKIPNGTTEPIARAIAFAGLMFLVSFAGRVAGALDLHDASELARRGAMVVLGVFLASIGNAIPKTLTPLAALQCDPTRVQAFQRFAGWTWVLTGLAFALAWIVLPVALARPATVTLIVLSMLLIATLLLRLRRGRPRAA